MLCYIPTYTHEVNEFTNIKTLLLKNPDGQ